MIQRSSTDFKTADGFCKNVYRSMHCCMLGEIMCCAHFISEPLFTSCDQIEAILYVFVCVVMVAWMKTHLISNQNAWLGLINVFRTLYGF